MQYEYYSILAIHQTASDDEIKKAYRKKAMEVHPDRHGGDKWKEAEFKKLNEAYSVLSDPQKKAHYDRHGTMDNHGTWGFWGGFQWGFDAGDLGDIFSSFFGGGMGGQRGQRRADIGEDIEMRLKVSLEDAIRGTSRKVEFDRETQCHHCSGKGGKTETCTTCRGQGQVRERVQTIFGVMEQAQPCRTCQGTGQRIIEKCTHCHGKGKLKEKIEKTIEVPAGIENGMSIKIRDEGHRGGDGNGDLYITFEVPSREGGLTREGIHLRYTVAISPAEATLGVAKMIEIPILGKKPLDIEAGIQGGTEITFRDEGLPRLDGRGAHKGNLILTIEIEIPRKLTTDQKKLYEAILQSEWSKLKKWWLEAFFS
jgi:molecular chaperone DnaJ